MRLQRNSVLCLLLIMVSQCCCAHYRVVEVYEILDVEKNEKNVYYAIAKNNVIVPELVVDVNGRYPDSQQAAWDRYEGRKEKVENTIDKKYKIPNNIGYQLKRFALMIGLIAVSPAVIPITYLSELMGSNEDRERIGFLNCVKNYFSISVNEPVYSYPQLKDEFEIVNVHNE